MRLNPLCPTTVCSLFILVAISGCYPTAPAPQGRVNNQSPDGPKETSKVIAEPLRPHSYKRVVVLSIGVSEYRWKSVPTLMYAESDAKAIAERMHALYGFEPVTLLG